MQVSRRSQGVKAGDKGRDWGGQGQEGRDKRQRGRQGSRVRESSRGQEDNHVGKGSMGKEGSTKHEQFTGMFKHIRTVAGMTAGMCNPLM